MPYITASVHVDFSEVADSADDEELREAGLVRFDADTWKEVAGAIRRRDFVKAHETLNDIARRSGGVDLPPFALAAVA
jgi:predicted metal-dependent hydrolase